MFLEFDGVGKRLGSPERGRHVVNNFTLNVNHGEFVCIVGRSGCGKTTILKIAAGLILPDSGRVLIEGRAVRDSPVQAVVVWQDYRLLAWRNTVKNVELGMQFRRVNNKMREAMAQEWLDRVGIGYAAQLYPHQLSGGMKQRAALARALACKPELMLMDEPFAAVDALSRAELQGLVEALWLEEGATVLFVTHSIEEAVRLGDRVIVMGDKPATIVSEHSNPAPHPRPGILSGEEADLANEIWRSIEEGESAVSYYDRREN